MALSNLDSFVLNGRIIQNYLGAAPFAMGTFVALLAIQTAALVEGQKQRQIASTQIAELVRQLDDDDYHVRESAYQQLKEIGIAALEAVKAAGRSAGPDLEKRVARLVKAIEFRRHAVEPIEMNGISFSCEVEKTWRFPRAGQSTAVRPKVKMTNVGAVPIYLNLQWLYLTIADDEGNYLANATWGNAPKFPKTARTPTLRSTESYSAGMFESELRHPADRTTASLVGEANMGDPYSFQGIAPGRYFLQFSLECPTGLPVIDGKKHGRAR
jgi:hypothetical protein